LSNRGRVNRSFVETKWFTERVRETLSDEVYAAFQRSLAEKPDLGRVIPGSGGLRKIRLAELAKGMGKRGGIRVIYLDIPEAERVFLLDIYEKGQKEDLSPAEKKVLKEIATGIKAETKLAFGKKNRI
jgi:hypothetical protein